MQAICIQDQSADCIFVVNLHVAVYLTLINSSFLDHTARTRSLQTTSCLVKQGAGFDGNLAPGVEAPKQTTRQVFRQMLLTARSRSW